MVSPFDSQDVVDTFLLQSCLYVVVKTGTIWQLKGWNWTQVAYIPVS
jgi:hypothetical protein